MNDDAWGSSHYAKDNINKVTSTCLVEQQLFKCKLRLGLCVM